MFHISWNLHNAFNDDWFFFLFFSNLIIYLRVTYDYMLLAFSPPPLFFYVDFLQNILMNLIY